MDGWMGSQERAVGRFRVLKSAHPLDLNAASKKNKPLRCWMNYFVGQKEDIEILDRNLTTGKSNTKLYSENDGMGLILLFSWLRELCFNKKNIWDWPMYNLLF